MTNNAKPRVGSTMQVFAQYMFSKAEINSDSSYVSTRALVRGMLKVRPNWHFWMPFPDANSSFKYDDDGFFKLPNVTRIPQRMTSRRHGSSVHFDSVWYDKMMRKVAIDSVWANMVEYTGHIKFSGDSSYGDTFKPVCVAAHHYCIHPSLPYPMDAMASTWWAQNVGTVIADWNVYNSRYTQQMVMDNVRDAFSDKFIQRVESLSSFIPYGVLPVDEFDYGPGDNDIPVIAYNHRLQNYKRWKETMSVLDELYREGVKFKLRYMNSNRENAGAMAAYPWVEIRLCKTRAEYIEAMRGCDVNTTNSQYETFCIAAAESMAMGHVLVAPNRTTFPEITGQVDGTDYPFLFNDLGEQKEMLRKVLTDKSLRRHWGKVVSDYVTTNFNSIAWAENYAQLFERLDAERVWTPKPENGKAFKECMESHDGESFHKFYRSLMKIKVNGKGPFGAQSCPMSRASRFVRRLGGGIRVRNGMQYLCANVK